MPKLQQKLIKTTTKFSKTTTKNFWLQQGANFNYKIQLKCKESIGEVRTDNKNNNKYLTSTACGANIDLLFAAGFETTSHSIEYILSLLAIYPKLQQQIHQELQKNQNCHLQFHD